MPTVVTLHGPSTRPNGDYLQALGRTVDVVAISRGQQRLSPRLDWAGVVHDTSTRSTFPFADRKDEFMLWLGRFHPDKGAPEPVSARPWGSARGRASATP